MQATSAYSWGPEPITGVKPANLEGSRAPRMADDLGLKVDPQVSVHALTAKAAGRLNASAATKEEWEALLSERQKLLDKKFGGSMSRSDENRLAYVRWSLDRIEDARHGHALDALEQQVARFEELAVQISAFRDDLKRHARNQRRK
jgi:hypothetical protein